MPTPFAVLTVQWANIAAVFLGPAGGVAAFVEAADLAAHVEEPVAARASGVGVEGFGPALAFGHFEGVGSVDYRD